MKIVVPGDVTFVAAFALIIGCIGVMIAEDQMGPPGLPPDFKVWILVESIVEGMAIGLYFAFWDWLRTVVHG